MMLRRFEDIKREDPYVTPRWRWERVLELYEAQAAPTRMDDPHIVDGLDFLRRMRKATTRIRLEEIRADHPHLFVAYKVFENADILRWQLEALTLSAADPEEMAAYLGTTPEVVAQYERFFFDVRDRLTSPGYIVKHTMAPAISAELDPLDRDFLWKVVGYWCGKQVLIDLWSQGELNAKSATALQELVENRMARNAVRAVYVQPVNKYTAGEVIQQWLERNKLDIQRKLAEGGTENRQFADAAQALIESIRFTVAGREEGTEKLVFVDGSAEFRAHEQMFLPDPGSITNTRE